MKRAWFGLVTFAALLPAQTPEQSIAATVTRTLTLTADIAAVEARVAVTPTMTTAEVLRVLNSTGFREEHLVGIQASGSATSSPQQFGGSRSDTVYSFQMTAPADSFRDLITRFETLRRQLPEGVTRLEHNIFLSANAQAADAARQAAIPELFAELRTRAEALAQAAGARLGPVLSLIDTGLLQGTTGGLFGLTGLPGTRVVVGLNGRFAKLAN